MGLLPRTLWLACAACVAGAACVAPLTAAHAENGIAVGQATSAPQLLDDAIADGEPALTLRWSYGLAGVVAAPVPAPERHAPRDWPEVPMTRLSVDVSLDTTARHGASQDASLTWAPAGGIHESGWRVRLSFNRSLYSYPVETRQVRGRSTQWDTMIGYGVHRAAWAATFLLGQAHAAAMEDGQGPFRQRGLKASMSVFAAPSERSRSFASLAYTEASDYTQALWKWGWVWGGSGAFIGPEIKSDWRHRAAWRQAPQTSRWGMHLSGLQWEGISLGGSAGRMWDEAHGVGAYWSMGLYSAF